MRKGLVLGLVVVLCLTFAGMVSAHKLNVVGTGDETLITTDRTIDDYAAALMELAGADAVGDILEPERNNVKYLFLPLLKDGEVIGYGTWVNTIIYSHPEDIIAVVNKVMNTKTEEKFAILESWKALDANDHHLEVQSSTYLKKYVGMTLETSFNPAVDIIAGSTYSSHTFFFELKNVLLTFEGYIDEEAIEVVNAK